MTCYEIIVRHLEGGPASRRELQRAAEREHGIGRMTVNATLLLLEKDGLVSRVGKDSWKLGRRDPLSTRGEVPARLQEILSKHLSPKTTNRDETVWVVRDHIGMATDLAGMYREVLDLGGGK